jgi:hypothetical protein
LKVQGPTTRRRIRLALKTAFVLMLWLPATLYVIAWSSTRLARDFGITDASPYATAVRQIERGESMYDPLPSPGPHRMGPHYLYPPVLAPLLSWGPDGNARAVQQLAYLLSMGGLVLFVLGITRLAAGPVSIVAPMLLFLLMKWKPRHLDAGLGEPLVVRFRPRRGGPRTRLAFRRASARARRRLQGDSRVGRAHPGDPRRVLLPLLATTAVLAAAAAITIGPGTFALATVTWLRDVAPTLSQGQFTSGTFTVGGVERPLVTFLVLGQPVSGVRAAPSAR